MVRRGDAGNFLIFLGGMMIVAGLVSPFFMVGMKLVYAYWRTGITLLVTGILLRGILNR